MEEKERYIIDRFDEDIFDTKKEYYPSNQTICEIINQQDKRTKQNPTFISMPYSAPKIYQQGWVCPKCGAVMSPTTNECPHCRPKDTFTC